MTLRIRVPLVLALSVITIGFLGTIEYSNFQFLSSIPLSSTSFTRSIVINHTLNLDNYQTSSGIDLIKYKNHYYPAYPPGYSLLAAPFYGGLQIINFAYTKVFGPMNGQISMFLESFVLELPSILALAGMTVLIYLLLCQYQTDKRISAATAWALPFTTFLLGYLPSAFFHLPAAFFLLLGFYLLISSKNSVPSKNRSLFIGLTFGMVALTEYVPALCFIPFGLYFFFKTRSFSKSFIVLAGFCAGLLALGIYNKLLFGSPLTFGESLAATANREGTNYGISFSGNPLVSLYGNYLSRLKGLLTNAPLAIFGLLGIFLLAKQKRVGGALAFIFIIIVSLVYAFWHDWGGGWSLGPRFYTSIVAFFFLGVGVLIDRYRKNIYFVVLTVLLGLGGVFTAFWSLMMGPRVIIPRAEELGGLVVAQRFNRLPIIFSEGPVNSKNVAPFLIQQFQELPILSGFNFSTWFVLYSALILAIIFGTLILLLKITKTSNV